MHTARFPPASPLGDDISTPIAHTTRRIIFESGRGKEDPPKAKTRVVASRFMQAPTPVAQPSTTSAPKPNNKTILHTVSKPPKPIQKVVSKPASIPVQPASLSSTTKPIATSIDSGRTNILLLNNLLLQYCFTNAVAKDTFMAQQERSEVTIGLSCHQTNE